MPQTAMLLVALAVITGPSRAGSLSDAAGENVLTEKAAELHRGYHAMMREAAQYDWDRQDKKVCKIFRKQLKALLKRDREAWDADEGLAAARPELEAVLAELGKEEDFMARPITKRLVEVQKRLTDSEEALEAKQAAKAKKAAADRQENPAPKRVFQSDWLFSEDQTSHEKVLDLLQGVQREAHRQGSNAQRFALSLKRSSEYKKTFKAFKKGLGEIREGLPAGWESDELLKDLHRAIEASVERAEKEGEDWKGKYKLLDQHADVFIEHLSKNKPSPEQRALVYWATQPEAPDPGVSEDFIKKVEAIAWPDPRPVPKNDYWGRRAIGEGVDMEGLQASLAESQARSREWYRAQSDALRSQGESKLANARLSGASYSSMRALATQQGRERREALDRAFTASNYMSAAAMNYAMTAAAEERERAQKRGDDYRLRLWRANLNYFEGVLQDATSGKLTGGPLVANVQAAEDFAADGVPSFFDYDPAKETRRLEAIRVTSKNLDYDLTKRGDWIPAPASYKMARYAAGRRFDPKNEEMARYAKIVNRILRNDPRAPEVLAASEKKTK